MVKKCTVSPEEVKRVKGLGFLRDKNTEADFNARVLTHNGRLSAQEMTALVDASKRFGSGELALTSRMTIELQGIHYDNIQPLTDFLGQYGLMVGGTGPKVRPIVACKGSTCQYGLIDTTAVAEEIFQRFYVGYNKVILPHKFKIAVGGCPNSCVKPDTNDFGIVGHPVRADSSDAAGSTPRRGFKIYVGGKWGKKYNCGQPLEQIIVGEDKLMAHIETALLLYRDQAFEGERFGDMINRIGFENAQAQLLSDKLLARKDDILSQPLLRKGEIRN